MTSLLQAGALLCTAFALLAAALCLLATRDVRSSLQVLLDLLLAAGLLRLAHDPSWTQVGTAAAVITVRRLIGAGLAAR